MVAIAKAVVDEWAVVVKMLDTFVADRAVKASFTLNCLTIGTKVVEVKPYFESRLYKLSVIEE